MNNHRKKIRNFEGLTLIKSFHKLSFAILLGLLAIKLAGQDNKTESASTLKTDSLSLNQIINQVIQNHPSIKEAEEALNIADAKIGLATSGYFPNVDLSGSYTRINPVPQLDESLFFPGKTGKINMAPNNNYNAAINYNQTIYDFGKTGKNVKVENENKNLAEMSVEQVKQNMTLAATASYYTLLYLQEAIKIKDEELANLQKHLEYVQKKKETGSATQYEILSTQVRISNVESQKIDLETGRRVQLSVLNSLIGQPEYTELNIKKELNTQMPEIMQDSLVSYALKHRDEMRIAKEKSVIAELQYKLAKAQTNPTINLYGSAGEKNGYFPNVDSLNFNYSVGVSLKIPLFDATRKSNNVRLSKSNIQNSLYEIEITRRNITNEVVQSNANVISSGKKINQFTLQLEQAQKALKLAEINYESGAITNLDLLDAATSVSESRLQLLKAEIDNVSNIIKLKISLGYQLY